MKEWIDFYKNVDKKTKGGLSSWLVFFIIPNIIAIIMVVFDFYLFTFFMNEGQEILVTDLTFIGIFFGWISNYVIFFLGVLISLLVLAVVFTIVMAVGSWFINMFLKFLNFIDIVKTAKSESFDNSKVDLDPEKKEMKLKS